MANQLYNNARKGFALGQFNWETDNIRAMLVRTIGYTFSAGNLYVAAIDAAARVPSTGDSTGAGILLAGKIVSDNGALRANNVQFVDVSGTAIGAVVLYRDSGNPATSPLIAWLDTATGLPITPNGGSIIVTWDVGDNGIFRL